MKKALIFLLCVVFNYGEIFAGLSLPKFFSDHIVLQRDKEVPVWGKCDPGKTVTVSFAGQKLKARANKDGVWKVVLKPLSAGGPYILSVESGKNKVVVNDVLVGEVWICSGQSNMEFTLSFANNAVQEITDANYPEIRSFKVQRAMSNKRLSDVDGAWQVCSPENAGDFSAVGYFFARELYKKLRIPVGIINSSWGGTDIQTWMSMESIGKYPKYTRLLNQMESPDFENQIKQNELNKKKFEAAFAGNEDPGISEKWYAENQNIADWKKTFVPALWNTEELFSLDGIVWFSYDFTLPEASVGQPAKLSLGPVDDNDVTWINGTKIGATEGYNVKRNYEIPAGILKEKNRITIKVSDYSGAGGIYGLKDSLFIQVGNTRFPLADQWNYKIALSNQMYHFFESGPNAFPSLLFNAMINPLIGYQIRGVIWYQGENNAERANEYTSLFPEMITDWRSKWKQEFPFYWVQLANYKQPVSQPGESSWANLRFAQSKTLSLPHTGQATIIDIGDANDIHPKNKQDVGKRLALIALHNDYGFKNIVFSGPVLKSVQRDGENLVISFDYTANGLKVSNKYGYVNGFAVAGADGKYYWAKARVEGNQVIVNCSSVSSPVSLRYAWADNPDDVNLYNSAGLPAVPFEVSVPDR
ncbi:MAG: sialate O-acetylesterase [Paludibacter sp.]|nr:sialate O-acetylesterase [Paludibacter sp.]